MCEQRKDDWIIVTCPADPCYHWPGSKRWTDGSRSIHNYINQLQTLHPCISIQPLSLKSLTNSHIGQKMELDGDKQLTCTSSFHQYNVSNSRPWYKLLKNHLGIIGDGDTTNSNCSIDRPFWMKPTKCKDSVYAMI